jgi:SAM-dependent methyltransferase
MTTNGQLLVHLQSRLRFKPQGWIDQLEDRKREEIDFHNFDREQKDAVVIEEQKAKDVHGNKKYYSISDHSRQYVDRWVEEQSRGRVFLDYACGNGIRAIHAARSGAALAIGLDISDVSVANARESAASAQMEERCHFVQGDCEATELPDESVDSILCNGMLHHLDLTRAYPELYRILRPGGRVLGVEALGHNPLIQLYRELTPHMRTEWEKRHILKQRDINAALRCGFSHGEVRYWHLCSLAAVPLRKTGLFGPAVRLLNGVDRLALAVPGLQLMAWQVTFELLKRG